MTTWCGPSGVFLYDDDDTVRMLTAGASEWEQ
jgi:hypothetical protein